MDFLAISFVEFLDEHHLPNAIQTIALEDLHIDVFSLKLFNRGFLSLLIPEHQGLRRRIGPGHTGQRIVNKDDMLGKMGGHLDVFQQFDDIAGIKLLVAVELNQVEDDDQFAQTLVGQHRVAARLVEKCQIVGFLIDGAAQQLFRNVTRIVQIAAITLPEKRHIGGIVIQNVIVVVKLPVKGHLFL